MTPPATHRVPITCSAHQPAAVVQLACFPHAGGGAYAFRRWATSLAPDVELWSATLPGRAARVREPFAREWAPLIDELATAINDAFAAPFALFGHSLGATVAFEVTRELSRRGAHPAHLFVSARGAPDTTPSFTVPADDGDLLRDVSALYGGVPGVLHGSREVLEYFLPILRADIDLAAAYLYRPGPRLDVPITALSGETDETVSRAQLKGWRRQTSASFEWREFPGGHFYFEGRESGLLKMLMSRLTSGVCHAGGAEQKNVDARAL